MAIHWQAFAVFTLSQAVYLNYALTIISGIEMTSTRTSARGNGGGNETHVSSRYLDKNTGNRCNRATKEGRNERKPELK